MSYRQKKIKIIVTIWVSGSYGSSWLYWIHTHTRTRAYIRVHTHRTRELCVI